MTEELKFEELFPSLNDGKDFLTFKKMGFHDIDRNPLFFDEKEIQKHTTDNQRIREAMIKHTNSKGMIDSLKLFEELGLEE